MAHDWICSDVQPQAHYPAPLSDLTIAGEAEILEQCLRPGMEVRTSLRGAALDLLRVGLDGAPTGGAYGIQDTGDRSPGNTATSVSLAGKDAADAPIRQLDQLPVVGARVLDVGHLSRRSVLAPADALIPVIDQDLMHRPGAHVRPLGSPVVGCGAAQPFTVEPHAP